MKETKQAREQPKCSSLCSRVTGGPFGKRCLNIQSLYSLIAGKAWIAFLSLPDVRSTLAKLIIIMGLEEIGHETGITFKCSP